MTKGSHCGHICESRDGYGFGLHVAQTLRKQFLRKLGNKLLTPIGSSI